MSAASAVGALEGPHTTVTLDERLRLFEAVVAPADETLRRLQMSERKILYFFALGYTYADVAVLIGCKRTSLRSALTDARRRIGIPPDPAHVPSYLAMRATLAKTQQRGGDA